MLYLSRGVIAEPGLDRLTFSVSQTGVSEGVGLGEVMVAVSG